MPPTREGPGTSYSQGNGFLLICSVGAQYPMPQRATLEKDRAQTDFGGQRSAHDIQQKLNSLPGRQYASDGSSLAMKWAGSNFGFITLKRGVSKNSIGVFGHGTSQVFDNSSRQRSHAPAELNDHFDRRSLAHT